MNTSTLKTEILTQLESAKAATGKQAIECFAKAGEALIALKAESKRGEFGPLLAEMNITKQSASNYTKIARKFPELSDENCDWTVRSIVNSAESNAKSNSKRKTAKKTGGKKYNAVSLSSLEALAESDPSAALTEVARLEAELKRIAEKAESQSKLSAELDALMTEEKEAEEDAFLDAIVTELEAEAEFA